MEQGNYKSLLLKLSGTALGLVVMLGGAAAISQNFIVDKSIESPKNIISSHRTPPASPDIISSHRTPPASPEGTFFTRNLSDELNLRISLDKEFKIIMDTGEWMDGEALRHAQHTLEGLKLEHFERLIDVNSDSIEQLRETIDEITQKMTIPEVLKEEILNNLEHQLEKAEMKVKAFESHVAKFSYKVFLPQSKYTSNGKCSQQEIIVEKCADGQCVEEAPVNNGRSDRKTSVAAFYWI